MKYRILVKFISLCALSPALAGPREKPIQPIQAAKPGNPALVELGKNLFFDPRLSKSGFISCHSPQPQHGRYGQFEDLDRRPLEAGADQRADRAQFQHESRTILGRARPT
jgi:cytochrome c peroxidase